MKTCPNCGELVGDSAENCFNCKYSFVSKRVVSNDELKRQKEERIKQSIERTKQLEDEKRMKEERYKAIYSSQTSTSDIMKTTGDSFEGYKITKYCGIVTNTALYGLGMGAELKNAFNMKAGTFGTEYGAFSQKMEEHVEDLMNELSALAMYKAANALIGVSYTCVPCNIEGITFILTATGTAVYIEKE